MNVPSHALSADINSLTSRLTSLEHRVAQLTPPFESAPASLPVDKMQLADYGRRTPSVVEEEDDSEDEGLDPMSNLTPQDLREVVAAFDELLRWKEFPNPSMGQEMQSYIERDNFRRLQEAMRPLENVVKAIE